MSVNDPSETWRDVEGFAGYQVSNLGRVRSRRKGGGARAGLSEEWHSVRPQRLPSGYLQVTFYEVGERRRFYVHRLVLTTFVGPCPENMQARHVNENDRSNNRLDNLAWGTPLENQRDRERHGTQLRGSQCASSKLTEEAVARMLADAAAGVAVTELSRRHGIRRENVSKILNGHHWRHVEGERKVLDSSHIGHVKTAEAAHILGVTAVRVQQLVRAGKLIAVRCRRGLMLEEAAVRSLAATRAG